MTGLIALAGNVSGKPINGERGFTETFGCVYSENTQHRGTTVLVRHLAGQKVWSRWESAGGIY